MTIYRDNYSNNIESPQKLYIQYSHDIPFDYSTGKYPDGTESLWHWENTYIPIEHKINGLSVGRHEWMRIKVGEPSFWTYPIRMSANVTNIQTVESVIEDETNSFSFTIKLTFEDGSTKESEPIIVKNGKDGIEITSALINDAGYLIITYSDGTIENAGKAKGEDASSIPLTGADDSILSISGNIPVWILPLQVLNAALSTISPLEYDINTGELSITKANTTTDGYLSKEDWNTFYNKQIALVSGTNIKTVNSQSLLGSGDIVITAGKSRTYQSLVSASTITMDTNSGVNAILTLGHDVTLTLSNLASGDEGNIEVTQGTPDHTITIIPTPYILNDGGSTIELLTGVGSKTILSYSYDGTILLVTYNKLFEETDPIFSQWLSDTPPAYPEDIPAAFDLPAAIHEATAETEILDNDETPFWKSLGTVLRKITFANLKATLKTYFDTLYFDTYDFACSDETTVITTGTEKFKDHWPYNFDAIGVFVGLNVVSSSGNPTFDFNDKDGNSIFSTRPAIVATEETSLTNGTQPVFATTHFAKGDKFTIDFDIAGTGAAGVKFHFTGIKS